MARGRQTRTLRKDQIERLEKFRKARHDGAPHGYSYPQLRLAMGMTFGWRSVQAALQGRPVWDLYHAPIAQWIERYLPAPAAPVDGKSLAAGMERSSEEAAPSLSTPSLSQRRGLPHTDAASEEVTGRGVDAREVRNDVEPDEEEAGATGTVRGSR